MSRIRLPWLLASLVLAGASAHATLQISPQRVEVTAPHVPVDRIVEAVRGIDAQYRMTDGRRMRVLASGDALQVQYGRRMARQLDHDGNGRFVSSDGLQSLRFELDERGEAQIAHLTMPASWQ